MLRSRYSGILSSGFIFQQAQCSQAVFHVFKGAQHGLVIVRDRLIKPGPRLVGDRTASPGIENGFNRRGARLNKAARAIEPVSNRITLKATARSERYRRIV